MNWRIWGLCSTLLLSCSETDPTKAGSFDAGTDSGSEALGGSSNGGSSGAAGHAAGGSGGTAGSSGDPMVLSQTGLYEADMQTLSEGVRAFAPVFPLWSDGATKRRWIKLPEGSTLDTSDMDYWRYPVGTKLWKEFTRDGVRVETRLIEKRGDDDWFMMAYVWNEDETDAEAAPLGLENARSTPHDVPSQVDCGTCHNKLPDRVLGFTAIQLGTDSEGLSLQTLIDEGKLSDPPSGTFAVPGDATTRVALGYLHANCGHCHNPESFISRRTSLQLRLTTSALDTPEETTIYQSTVGVETDITEQSRPEIVLRIDPGSPQTSAVFDRMSLRGTAFDMPKLGTELVDEAALENLATFIQNLD